jgi:hypothetical protein
MAIKTTTGVKFSVGTQSLTPASDTYVAVGEIEEFGGFGDSSEIISFNSLTDNRVRKVAGIRDAGEFELTYAVDWADAGQTALVAAHSGNTGLPFNFRVELNDDPTPGTGNGTRLDFSGVVAEIKYEPGKSNSVFKATAKIAITTGVTKTAAA